MNLSDLGSANASAAGGANVSAAANLDPSAAISQGSSLFDKAYTQAGGSITGTVAVAASIVSDLPAGQAKQLLSDVLGIASGAAAGAAIGSVVPGWGTAVGAAVGAVMGAAESIFGGSGPSAPEGDVRSTAEQFCFPAAASTPATDTEAASLFAESLAQPACWPDIRIHSPGYQVPFQGTDPATGQSCPVQFTFGTGWVSPPGTTASSQHAAWYLAQAWLARSPATRAYALAKTLPDGSTGPGDLAQRQQAAAAAEQQAGTVLGSDVLTQRALTLVDCWYGTRFGPNGGTALYAFTAASCKGVNPNFGWTPAGGSSTGALVKAWAKLAACMNKWNSLDYVYYFSTNLELVVAGNGSAVARPTSELGAFLLHEGNFFCAMPDTTLVALCELAALVVLGVVPEKGSDHVALHFVMALAWLWRRGQEKDAKLGSPIPIGNHENFSRIIGLLSHRLHLTKPAPAPKKGATSAKGSSSSSTSTKGGTARASTGSTTTKKTTTTAHKGGTSSPAPLTAGGALALIAATSPAIVAQQTPVLVMPASSPASRWRWVEIGAVVVTLGLVVLWWDRRQPA